MSRLDDVERSQRALDVVVRWRGDVIALERIDARRGTAHAGPFVIARTRDDVARVNGAPVALPCTIARGPLTLSLALDERAACAHDSLRDDVDPTLVRALGVPLVLMAGFFAAMTTTEDPHARDDAFAFSLGAETLGASFTSFPTSSSTFHFASASASASASIPSETPRAPQRAAPRAHRIAENMFAPIERVDEQGMRELLSMLAHLGDETSSLNALVEMNDALVDVDVHADATLTPQMIATITAGEARSGGDIGAVGSLGIGLTSGIDDTGRVASIFGPGTIATGAVIELDKLRYREPQATRPEPRAIERPVGAAVHDDGIRDRCPTRRDILDAVGHRMPALRACAERWPDQAVGPRLRVEWQIARNGDFTDVKVFDVEPRALARCIEDAVTGARVPSGCHEEIRVVYPLLFDAAR